jgi:hypothetical protein
MRVGFRRVCARVLFAAAILAPCELCSAADQPAAPLNSANSGLYVKVQLDKPIKLSKLKPGEAVEGNLARDVFSADHKLFAEHSRMRLLVDHIEKRRRARNDHWPWVINFFSPRHENYPVFTTATVSGTEGQSLLRVSLISVSRLRDVHAQAKKRVPGHAVINGPAAIEASQPSGEYESNKRKAPVMVLEASAVQSEEPLVSETRSGSPPETAKSENVPENVPAGTACKILLLGDVSASRSKPGDLVQARLLEPVLLDSQVVLPAGSLFQGTVVKRTPPRWGSRAGSLAIAFTGLTLPGGNLQPISASVAGAELDRRSHTKIDSEGQLHGEHPGKAWMAINIGVTAGLAKEADDTLQLIVEALVSSATDVSTAGAGRIVSTCVSGIFMVTRHGRDVVLPRFTEMDIAFDRPVSVTRSAEAGPSVNLVHGN